VLPRSLALQRLVTPPWYSSSKGLSMASCGSRLANTIVGTCLLVVGLAFLVLLGVLRYGGQLAGDVKVSAFMLGVAGVLMWCGCGFLRTCHDGHISEGRAGVGASVLLGLRISAEVAAALGCMSMLAHVAFMVIGCSWPPRPVFISLLVGPVVIGQTILRVLAPDAFEVGVFPRELVEGWSTAARRVVTLFLRVGWLGYIAIPLAWPGVSARIPAQWGRAIEIIGDSLISALYASQVLMLHFGAAEERGEGKSGGAQSDARKA